MLTASALLAAAAISCFSGYRSATVPHELIWQISPLGLLGGFQPELMELKSASSFAGRFELSFDYFQVFAKTCFLEAPFYFLIFRKKGPLFFVCALVFANLLTHPAVFFVFPGLFERYLDSLFSAEIFAPLIESLFVAGTIVKAGVPISPWRGVALVFLANLFSWQVGVYW